MYKTIQETTFGQLVYLASGRRLFSYPQDQPGYQAPQKYLPGHQVQQTEEEKPQRPAPASRTQSTQTTQTGPFLTPPETPSAETDLSQGPPARQYSDDATLAEEGQAGHKSGKASPRYERSQSQNSWQGEKKEEQYPWEVKWEDNDPDLPLHWSVPKKCFVTFCICALTFGVYAGSSIVTPSIENIMTTFGVGQPVAGLSLTLFVFGYGTGPLVLSPLSEIPQIAIVFTVTYGFNGLETGLAYMGIFAGAVVTYAGYVVFDRLYTVPKMSRNDGFLEPEERLIPALFGAWWLPICLFSFGWTANASIHWMVPIVCSGTFSIGVFLLFQAVLNYLADAYPDYQASVLAGNDTMRSLIGGAFPIFATAMFKNLQKKGPANFPVSWGCTLLGCISIVMIPLPFILYKYGKQIRSHSKFATHD